ncbi:Homoserine kinase [Geodia barretti]|uniref:Homoserine kinase n=1 Tax=Geodia barretti TaxID=519541 RepID=A0AA35XDJ9_GEOBA|nr:Homoserine kinase [Geodia barretti]
MGPGFDCLGMALDLWNRLTVTALADGAVPRVEVAGEGEGELATDTDNLVYQAMAFLYEEAREPMTPMDIHCQNAIPLSRGLGSSAAAISGGLVAANAMLGNPYGADELLEMAATIEGHPDNVAAAVYGGMRLVVTDEDRIYTAAISIPPQLQAVLFVPERRIATVDARRVLPAEVTVADAVFNMSRAALLVAGMQGNHPEYLRIATQDRLHQPYRQSIFPPMKVIFTAAMAAGALGVFLSGSGSTIMALAEDRAMTVAYEMFDAARLAGVEGRVEITQPTELGAHVISGDSDD